MVKYIAVAGNMGSGHIRTLTSGAVPGARLAAVCDINPKALQGRGGVPTFACGARAINGLMQVARRRDLAVELLDQRNSGDRAGDRSRVVGYGSYAVYET